jgi:hypothetical protein
MGIIENMYGGGGGGKPVKTDYYGSFGYWNDVANGVGPPPADKGGPTAMQLAINEGYADENGMLSNGVHSIVNAMYGGGPQKITSGQSLNPDYQAGFSGQTVGGVGDTDAWGRPVNWGQPQGAQLKEGDTHSTPAGDYKVEKNPWGQFVLVPQGDAVKSTGPYLTNMTSGNHHLGINPNTGEVWYQEAAGQTNFSGGGNSYSVNPNGPGYTPPNNGGGNNGGRSWQDVYENGITGPDGNPAGHPELRSSAQNQSRAALLSGNSNANFDPFLGMNTGSEPIQWDQLIGNGGDMTRLNEAFENLASSGVFGQWSANPSEETKQMAESAYAKLLRNLGLA